MKDLPLLSIILPNYNYARYLAQRIESILNQSYTNFELLILDDASTDNSKEIIQQYQQQDKRIKTYFNETNSGNPFVQWQKGIELSAGEYIWIAEADDWSEPDFLLSILPYFENNNELGLCFCQSVITNENGDKLNQWKPNSCNYSDIFENIEVSGLNVLKDALIFENIIPNASAVIFRKEFYNKVGGIDICLNTNADWLLWIKIACLGQIAFEKKVLNYFRRHSQSVISRIVDNNDIYVEKYDLSMRKKLRSFLRNNNIKINKLANKINQRYIGQDMGNKSLWLLSRKKYFKSFVLLFKSTFILHSFGFIRKSIKLF